MPKGLICFIGLSGGTMQRKMILHIALCVFSALLTKVAAQEPAPNEMVRSWKEGAIRPKATLNDVRWLEGDWEGKLEGGMQQYMAFAPVSGHMPGFGRGWGPDGNIWYYEINDFVEVDGSLEFRVKHFSGELADWEGKDGFLRHRLVALTDNTFYFDGITIVREGADHQTVYVRITEGERKGTIIVVHQTRVTRRQ
jgi:hypothetical protein